LSSTLLAYLVDVFVAAGAVVVAAVALAAPLVAVVVLVSSLESFLA